MAEETRERSTTSAMLWPEATASDMADSDRWIYFMKGTGSDRDKRLPLGVLRAWLQSHFGDITAEDITAESLSVVGNNASAQLTETLFKMLAGSSKNVQMNADGVTFTDDSGSTTFVAKFGRQGLEISNGAGLKAEIDTSGNFKVSEGTSPNNKSVIMSKTGITVTIGSDSATIGLVDGELKVSAPKGVLQRLDSSTVSTGKLRRVYVNAPITYSFQGTTAGINASTAQATLTSSSVLVLGDGISSASARNINLDWTPTADTELVIDFQSTSATHLTVNSGAGTSTPICNQAPNTVRRYVYGGSTTGWTCLY